MMNLILIKLLLGLLASGFTPDSGEIAGFADEPAAETIEFNEGWLFHRGDHAPPFRFRSLEDLDTPTTREWTPVDLPHDWSVTLPFDSTLASATGYLPGGIGWYQKSFEWSPAEDEQVSIYFEAVSSSSKVWINGEPLGERPNGYISFEYDLTSHLVDGTNVITVMADRSKYSDSRWYPGAGIYGNVYLNVREELFIPTWGVYLTTPEITKDHSTVRVQTSLENQASSTNSALFRYRILDPAGEQVASAEQSGQVGAESVSDFSIEMEVPDPQLWSPESPDLYSMVVEVERDGQLMDRREVPFGIRYFHFDADEGFFLNGENRLIQGVCLHHDAGVFGAAVPKRVWERRLAHLKESGANAIRISHNPAPPHLLELADSMGFLVMAEAFDEWRHPKNKWINGWNVGEPGLDGYSEFFDEWSRQDLKDMILRDRNHTSVILWSIGNEIDYPNDPYSHPVLDDSPESWQSYLPEQPHANELGDIAEEFVSIVKELDDTRPVTAALASTFMSNHTGYPQALDVVGYNYQESRYAEDRANYPERIIIGSENSRANYDAWRTVLDNDYVSGQFIWTGIDYLGEAGRWPNRSSGSGFLDLAGFKKARFYIQKAFWDSERFVQVATTTSNNPSNSNLHWDYAEGDTVNVFGFTNLGYEFDYMELFVNGQSLGRQTRDQFVNGFPRWEAPFEPGTVRVQIVQDGTVTETSSLETPGDVDHLELNVDREQVSSSGPELIHAVVTIRDQNGILAANSSNTIQYELTGPAKVVGMESGNSNSHEVYQSGSNSRNAHNGKLMIYLQTTGESGTVDLTVRSGDLDPGSFTINVE
ncbi:MAG: glycoside hydrolase family 2 TIM barrel-domain containing protein [Balneolaceae bacterium]